MTPTKKILAYIGLTGMTLFGAASAPVIPREMDWVRSYTTYRFDTPTGDLSPTQYARLEDGSFAIHPKEDISLSIVTEQPKAKTEVGVVCTSCQKYAEFRTVTGDIERFSYDDLGLDDSAYTKLADKGGAAFRPKKQERVNLFQSQEAEAAVAYDATSNSGTASGMTTVTFAHTMPSSGTLIVAALLMDSSALSDRDTQSCTYNGDQTYYYTVSDANKFRNEIYVLPNADSGANNVFCTFNDAKGSTPQQGVVLVGSFTGTDLHIPTTDPAGNSGTSAQSSVTVTTSYDNEMVITFSATEEVGGSDVTVSGNNNHVERAEFDNSGGASQNWNFGSTDTISPAGSGTYSWDWVGAEVWNIVGLALRPPCNLIAGSRCTDIVTTVGTSTWTAPTGVSSVDVACWGAGGGGESGGTTGNGGGGGGAYASTTGVSVTAGVGYDVYIGTGGAAESDGQRSHFYNGTTYSPIACGGTGTANATGGAGGTTACSLGGAAETAGGTGGNGNDAGDNGGGGGGSGDPDGTSSNGVAGNGTIGGNGGAGASTLGGTGGSGANGVVAGAPGAGGYFGGGGGGGGDNGSAGGAGSLGGGGGGGEAGGAAGGNGMCHISYTVPAGGGGGATDVKVPDLLPLF